MNAIISSSERCEFFFQVERAWRRHVDCRIGRAHRDRALQLREAVVAHVSDCRIGVDCWEARVAQLIVVVIKIERQIVGRETRLVFLKLGRFFAKIIEVEFGLQFVDASQAWNKSINKSISIQLIYLPTTRLMTCQPSVACKSHHKSVKASKGGFSWLFRRLYKSVLL